MGETLAVFEIPERFGYSSEIELYDSTNSFVECKNGGQRYLLNYQWNGNAFAKKNEPEPIIEVQSWWDPSSLFKLNDKMVYCWENDGNNSAFLVNFDCTRGEMFEFNPNFVHLFGFSTFINCTKMSHLKFGRTSSNYYVNYTLVSPIGNHTYITPFNLIYFNDGARPQTPFAIALDNSIVIAMEVQAVNYCKIILMKLNLYGQFESNVILVGSENDEINLSSNNDIDYKQLPSDMKNYINELFNCEEDLRDIDSFNMIGMLLIGFVIILVLKIRKRKRLIIS